MGGGPGGTVLNALSAKLIARALDVYAYTFSRGYSGAFTSTSRAQGKPCKATQLAGFQQLALARGIL
jgi:hypothetical protein